MRTTYERPTSTPALLQEAALRALLGAGVPKEITAASRKGHFVIEISFGDCAAVIANAKDEVRPFSALSTVAVFLARLGCHRFEVDTTHYEPALVPPAQPERSAAMRAGQLPRAKPARSAKAPAERP